MARTGRWQHVNVELQQLLGGKSGGTEQVCAAASSALKRVRAEPATLETISPKESRSASRRGIELATIREIWSNFSSMTPFSFRTC
jgi:hypothetical protein